jgi:hypothetical protein
VTTKRTPINHATKTKISPAAIAAFRRMLELEEQCTCPTLTWEQHFTNHDRCKACEIWQKQNSFLCRELRLEPWEWPAYQHPDATAPYPELANRWKPNLEAQERFRMLNCQ